MTCFCPAILARVVRRSGVPVLLRSSYSTSELNRWQRRCDRLTQLQRKISFPPLETIVVNGETIKLPLPAVEPVCSPNQEELEYLVGFFDGDGCVTMNKQTGHFQLSISQSVDSVQVLLHFRTMLGGGVYKKGRATGCQKATVQWSIKGTKMRQAAMSLSRLPSMKQAQLLIAGRGKVALNDRALMERTLRSFKQKHHVPRPLPRCSWPYFAGFFDAEGCVSVGANHGLRLQLEQVNPGVLVQLQSFLYRNQLQSWSLNHYARRSALTCWNLDERKKSLERLLASGLLVKRQQAELAVSLTASNHLRTRDAISALNGWQNCYQRLDREGARRAAEIKRARERIRWRMGSGQEHGALQRQLDELRSEHVLQNLIARCSLLRKNMRRALREGGK